MSNIIQFPRTTAPRQPTAVEEFTLPARTGHPLELDRDIDALADAVCAHRLTQAEAQFILDDRYGRKA